MIKANTLLLSMVFMGLTTMEAMAQASYVNPMVEALWSQGKPFNNDCPILEGQTSPSLTGCGATAVAQILYYYKRPMKGFGHAQYDVVDMDFEQHPIDWSNILNSYKGSYGETQAKAVANLMYVVGAAMKMHYHENSSSPYNYPSMMWGLQHFLHFSPQSRYRRRLFYSTAEWIEMLNNELENGNPVFYRGDHTEPDKALVGHMYVIDGRDNNGNYHYNFGHANTSQNKYADLNLANQGDGIWPGVYGVCYHHRQAMVTDFVPTDNLTDDEFDKTAIVLESPIVLDDQPHASTVTAQKTVKAKFQFRYVNFVGRSIQFSLGFYQGNTLVATSSTIRPGSLTDGGYALKTERNYTLPTNLSDGGYEMSIISRDDAESPWIRGWDNAPNKIPVSVKEGVFTFHMPNYHTLESRLYLEDGIKEIKGNDGGKTFELTVCNPTDNNFEDSLRISITNNGETTHSYQATSIYDGQKITYRYFVSDSKASFNGDYSVQAYYKESNTNQWILLTDYETDIQRPASTLAQGIEILTLNGICLKHLTGVISDEYYSQFLTQLPKGIYLIRDKNGTRKFAKRK